MSSSKELPEYEKISPDGTYRIGDLGKVVVSNSGAKRDFFILNGVTKISSDNLYDKELTSVVIPESVTHIEDMAFVKHKFTSLNYSEIGGENWCNSLCNE